MTILLVHRIEYFIVVCILYVVNAKVNHVLLPSNMQCASNEFFDQSGMTCTNCNFPLIPSTSYIDEYGNSAGCECTSTSLNLSNQCSTYSLQGGTCAGSQCSFTCNIQSLAVSQDQQFCIPCQGDTESTSSSSTSFTIFDPKNDECSCQNPKISSISSSSIKPVITRKLVEIYDPTTAKPIRKSCATCPIGTAVIPFSLSTAGVNYKPDPHTCASCPDPNMYFDSTYNCRCSDGFVMVGEASFGEQSCIDYSPTITSKYSQVTFYIQQSKLSASPRTLDSISFSHYYLKAASLCEFAKADSPETIRACQTLGNLCVMSMYNELSTPCREFQVVIGSRRLKTYHGQDDWRIFMPWLYYLDEANDIVDDKRVNTKFSFHEMDGHEHLIHLKLSQYSLDGSHLGFQDLTSQLILCGNQGQNMNLSWLRFGHSVNYEKKCSLKGLLEEPMYFYDAYFDDKGLGSCPEDKSLNKSCLYPLPVLIRNFIVDGPLFPNKNFKVGDESDDRYMRRFFLVDNLSGKTNKGLQIIRYASTIVLQITIQSEDSSRIYPPKLIIEYAELEVPDWSIDDDDDVQVPFTFKVEYTMETDRFWASVEIVIGFVTAGLVILWILRVYNFQNRCRRHIENGFSEGISGTALGVHAIMMFCHTFVLIFGPFVMILSLYWFIFFKMQNTVFLLLPPDNELYGIRNEYFFFKLLLHALFWCQTIYVAYVIYLQCRVDVFFMDWEKPKGRYSDVSMWRTIMIGKEWCNLQTRRKTSIELNIILILFFLLGLGFDTVSISKPGLAPSEGEELNIVLRFVMNVLLWILISLIQVIWRFTFYERYLAEPPAQRFIDLSTLAKISTFILDETYHGYYLHCRSPYYYADCSVSELCEQMRMEGEGCTADRGLHAPGCPPDCQTFELFISAQFRQNFNIPYSHLMKMETTTSQNSSSFYRKESIQSTTKSDISKCELNTFLINFIEQSPTPQIESLKRIIKEPIALEKFFGIAPADIRGRESKCILYPDQPVIGLQDFAFLRVTFLGIECSLIIQDILTYNLFDMIFKSATTSAFITYCIHLLRLKLRHHFGLKNVVRKSFLKKMFIEQ